MNDPPHILVVDDSEANRDIIVTRLRAHGYQTSEAADGEQGIGRGGAQRLPRPDLARRDDAEAHRRHRGVRRRLKGDGSPPVHADYSAHRQGRHQRCGGRARRRRRRISDQACRSGRARRQGAIGAAPQGALRTTMCSAQADDLRRNGICTLEQRVTEQVDEIERVGRLKRFLPPSTGAPAHVVTSGRRERAGEPSPRGHRAVLRACAASPAFAEVAEPC